MLHLITFATKENKIVMIDSKWLENWFLELRDVNDSSTSLWRETWLKVYSVPLSAWGYKNFYNIGCIFDRVLLVDHSNYDHASVSIYTDVLFKINAKLAMDINGKSSKSMCLKMG